METKENKIVISLNPNLYSLEAIYGAAYTFLNRAYIFLEEDSKSRVRITLKGKEKLTKKELRNLEDEFLNEVLNFSLRNQISKSNKKIREYIVATVLMSASGEGSSRMRKGFLETNRKPLERKEREIGEEDFSDIPIPWDKEYVKEKPPEKRLWRKDRLGFVVPWDEKSPEKGDKKRKKKKNWEKDPLGIAIPWEEKFETRKKSKNK